MTGYTLDGRLFPTKTSVFEMCKSIRGPYKPGNPHIITDSSEIRFLTDLVALHPDAEIKIGVGVSRFRVASDLRLGVCFWIDRIDGSATDFSFNECLNEKNPWSDFRACARNAVRDQILGFLHRNLMLGTSKCAVSGALLETGLVHVDHAAPLTFDQLLRWFVEETVLDWARVPLTPSVDGNTTMEILDPLVKEEWAEYHRTHSKLRLVTRTVNLSQLRLKG